MSVSTCAAEVGDGAGAAPSPAPGAGPTSTESEVGEGTWAAAAEASAEVAGASVGETMLAERDKVSGRARRGQDEQKRLQQKRRRPDETGAKGSQTASVRELSRTRGEEEVARQPESRSGRNRMAEAAGKL